MMMFRQVFAVCTLLALAACGGGGGGSGTSTFIGGGTTGQPTLTVSVNPTTVTAATPGIVSAKVVDAAGVPVAGQVVQFSTQGNLGKFSAPSALTATDGTATVTVQPTTATTTGADLIVATSTVGTATVTGKTGFQLTATDVSIASFVADVGSVALQPYAQTTLTVTLSAGSAGNPVNISVSSSCVTRGLAVLTPASATTSTGSTTFTYRDNGCGADLRDTLQASVTGTTSTRSLQLNLSAPTAASIEFVSALPATIFLRGSGFVENSTVTFRVRDAAGNGVRGQSVQLEPTTLAGGLQVDDRSTGFPISKVTDTNGNVIVRVNSGTVPTPVRVRASTTVAGASISTVSSTLAIAIGLPSQLNFSLSQGSINIEGYDRDGTPNSYTIIASDRLANPVPDGTAINFVAEGGQVQAIRQTLTLNGLSSATANFQTSSPRPVDGRVTVLAYALGEKSFLDVNGDNVYSAGELFQDIGDPYIDRLFNGQFTSAPNQYIEQIPGGVSACLAASSPLLALDVTMPSRPNTCIGTWGRSYVRRAAETIFSTSSARPTWGISLPSGSAASAGSCPIPIALIRPNAGTTFPAYAADGSPNRLNYYAVGTARLYSLGGAGAISLFASDANPVAYNPMAAGTTVSASGTDGITATVVGGSPVPSTSAPTLVVVNYKFDNVSSGSITLSFRSPGGLTTSVAQFVAVGAPPVDLTPCP